MSHSINRKLQLKYFFLDLPIYCINRPKNIDPNSSVLKLFDEFREELDEKHDRNERIVKLSRDVTIGKIPRAYESLSGFPLILGRRFYWLNRESGSQTTRHRQWRRYIISAESKRVIFTLHRSVGMDKAQKDEIFLEAVEKLNSIRTEKFRQIASEIKSVEIYQFLKSITWGYQVIAPLSNYLSLGGCFLKIMYSSLAFTSFYQEYIEAVSFLHYLQGGGLLTPQISERDFVFPCEESAGEADASRCSSRRETVRPVPRRCCAAVSRCCVRLRL